MSKCLALVAHDARKPVVIEWATANRDILVLHRLWGTGMRQRPAISCIPRCWQRENDCQLSVGSTFPAFVTLLTVTITCAGGRGLATIYS